MGEDVFEMQLGGANNPNAVATGQGLLGSKTNYLLGNVPSKWHTDVANYSEVQFANVYPGIDLDYLSVGGQLEYQFVMHPGANPNAIQLNFSQWGQVNLESDGSLQMVNAMNGNVLTASAPVLSQSGVQTVTGGYAVNGSGQVSFQVGSYDSTRDLVIDPSLVFSTYLGGTAEAAALGVATDPSGDTYVDGFTGAANGTQFPLSSNPYQTTGTISTDTGFVTKFNPGGNLIYSTFLGGSGTNGKDTLRSIAVDPSTGDAWVAGDTSSTAYPTTPSGYQPNAPGNGTFAMPVLTGLNAAGDGLVYSTYLSGSSFSPGQSQSTGAAVAFSNGKVYMGGNARTNDWPTTSGVVQSSGIGTACFVAEFDPTQSGAASVVWSTLVCGTNNASLYALTVFNGDVYFTGAASPSAGGTGFPITPGAAQATGGNSYAIELNSTGTAYIYGTMIGGGGDTGNSIAVDSHGNAYVAGQTGALHFPTTPGAFQTTYQGPTGSIGNFSNGFVVKLNATGTAFDYATYLGGNNSNGLDTINGLVVDSSGDAYVTGSTGSSNFPLVNPIQTLTPTESAGFVSILNPAGSALIFSTFLGNDNTQLNAIGLDSANNIYVAGQSQGNGYMTTPGAFQTTYAGSGTADNAVVSKIGAVVAPPPPPPPGGGGGGGGGGGSGPSFPPDQYEPNDSEDQAFNFGTVVLGAAPVTIDSSISTHPDGALDYDWYTWTTNGAGTFSATLSTTAGGPLEVHIFTVNASNTLIEDGSATVANGASGIVGTALSAGQPVWVEVKGQETSPGVSTQGLYTLKTSLN